MARTSLLLLLLATLLISPQTSDGQVGGGVGGVGGAGGGGGAGGQGGGNNQNSSGILIDPDGVLSLIETAERPGLLDKKRRESASKKNRPHGSSHVSARRYVSLVALEKEFGQLLSEDKTISEELFYLAGLQRIDFILVFPDEQDLVIAGPAENFVRDAVGRMIGVASGRPTLRLDDFIVALRTVGKAKQLGCSIDPVPQRLAELQNFIRMGEPATVDVVEARFRQMDEILGLQTVRIDGVPSDSHFATILVEADYRMKRIAIGLENPQVKGLKSHLAMLGTSGNTMQRWWFVPFYESISCSGDRMAFQFAGQRAQLLAEEEIADASGNRSGAATTKKSTQAYAKQFTEKFSQLADASPVFGELQNLIDWMVLAALLRKEQVPERIQWKQDVLRDEQRWAYPVFDVPKKVPSQVNFKRAGNQIVGLVCGGVVVDPQQAYEKSASTAKDSTTLDQIRRNALTSARNDSHHWWWDADR